MAAQFFKARQLLSTFDPNFVTELRRIMTDHLTIEATGVPVAIYDYVLPTAAAFGYVFSLASRLVSDNRQLLIALGRHIGAAVIALDCAADWSSDRVLRHFNPLRDERDVEAASVYALQSLSNAHELCCEAFGANSMTAQTLQGVKTRVLRRLGQSCSLNA